MGTRQRVQYNVMYFALVCTKQICLNLAHKNLKITAVLQPQMKLVNMFFLGLTPNDINTAGYNIDLNLIKGDLVQWYIQK